MTEKQWYKSKTLWIGILTILIGIITAIAEQLTAGLTITALGVLNIILRVITNSKITI